MNYMDRAPMKKDETITYLWSDGMIDNIARKVAEEPMEEWLVSEEEE